MIEGLKVTVEGTELKTLCEGRAKFHDDRARFYAEQKMALPEIDEDSVVPPGFSNSGKKPQEMMEERIHNHRAEASELRFIAAHLKSAEEYQLDRADLAKLGVLARGW